jgi:hypothetical protein
LHKTPTPTPTPPPYPNCPGCSARLYDDPRHEDKCIISGDFCLQEEHTYYLRYGHPELDDWAYVLCVEGDASCDEASPPCKHYTCAKDNIDCQTYIWEVVYESESGWVVVCSGTVYYL